MTSFIQLDLEEHTVILSAWPLSPEEFAQREEDLDDDFQANVDDALDEYERWEESVSDWYAYFGLSRDDFR